MLFQKKTREEQLKQAWEKRQAYLKESIKLEETCEKLRQEAFVLFLKGDRQWAVAALLKPKDQEEINRLEIEGSYARAKGIKLFRQVVRLGDKAKKLRKKGNAIWLKALEKFKRR